MSSITRTVALTLGLLVLPTTPSLAQPVCVAPGCNPTTSDANSNTAGGTSALSHLAVGGVNNTAFGRSALQANTTGVANTATGVNALFSNTTGGSNTASGVSALLFNTTGSGNTATGTGALRENTTGFFNTATGVSTLVNNTTGTDNTAIGHQALLSNTTGNVNTAVGADALTSNTTGTSNTASGVSALASNTTGNNNTAAGGSALESNTIGNLNTASGFQALQDNTAGVQNTAIGAKALKKSTGTKNIGIGFQAGVSLIVGNNNIYIGNQGAGDEFQTIRIGTAQGRTFIAGIGSTPVSGAIVMVDTGTGQLGSGPPSSARYKQDIETMGHRSAGVLQLRPVTFAYRGDAGGTAHYGLVAEEVAAVYPELVVRAATGEVQTVKYLELIPMLLNELQRQQQTLERQQRELTELRTFVWSRLGQATGSAEKGRE